MYLLYAILSSCLAVLPPADTTTRRSDTHIHVQVNPHPYDSGRFSVRMDGCNPEQWVEVRIINVIGRQVMARTFTPTEAQHISLNFTHLPRGMYLVEVKQGNCKQVRRVLYQ